MTFIASGVVALACIPICFVFERLGWFAAAVRLIQWAACVLCVLSAVIYLVLVRRGTDRPLVLGLPVRPLAYTALVLAGGFLLMLAVIIVLIALSPGEF